jgi:hypothetical protein
MDWAFEQAQSADHDIAADNALTGIQDGLTVTENHLGADLSVDIVQGVGYSSEGLRVFEADALTNLDCSVDEYGVSTAVGTGGNERWLSVFARFDRDLQDPAIDGNGLQVWTKQLEDCELIVRQGAEDTIASAVKPALIDNAVLLADINLVFGQTTIQTATHIKLERRQDWIRLTGTTLPDFVFGNAHDAIEDIWNTLDTWAGSGSPFTFTSTWVDGKTVKGVSAPPTNVKEALDAIVYDLSRTSGALPDPGARLIGINGYTASGGNVTWPASNVKQAIIAVADAVDTFVDTLSVNSWAFPLSNFKKFLNDYPNAGYPEGVLWHPNNGKWISADINVYVSDDGQEWNAVSAHTLASGVDNDAATIDTTRYILGLTISGNLEYCTDPDGSWSTDSGLGGSGSLFRLATKFPSSDSIMAHRGNSLTFCPTGVGGTWATPTTPPSGITGIASGLVWIGGSNWIFGAKSTGSGTRIFLSTDDGDNWTEVAASPLTTFLGSDINVNQNTGAIVAVGEQDVAAVAMILRSTDNGATFTPSTINYPPALTSLDKKLYRVIYVAGTTWVAAGTTGHADMSNIVVSHDDGVTWDYVGIRRFSDSETAYDMFWGNKSDTQVVFVGDLNRHIASMPIVGI